MNWIGIIQIVLIIAATGVSLAKSSAILIPVVIVILYFSVGSLLLAYTKSRVGNLVFNNTQLESHVSFVSHLELRKLALLYLVNMFAILFSLGLAVPWAVIRVVRYRAECLQLRAGSSLDSFISGVAAQVSATGEELGEFFSVDLSL